MVQTLCRSEAAARPCPQVVLMCCTALNAAALETECIFKIEPEPEKVDSLADRMCKRFLCVLNRFNFIVVDSSEPALELANLREIEDFRDLHVLVPFSRYLLDYFFLCAQ